MLHEFFGRELTTSMSQRNLPPRSMADSKHEISIIIPTLVAVERTDLLMRAINSVLTDQGSTVVPIVVANGNRFAPEVLAALKSRRDIRYLYREEGDVVAARLAGRKLVDTEFFGALDDDDEFL